MGFKPWRYLSLVAFAFAGAVLMGCNSTNPPNRPLEKAPPGRRAAATPDESKV